jgi:hypothetical protein
MNDRSRALSAVLACLAIAALSGCGEKEEPELGELPPPPAGAAPGGGPGGGPEPTEGRPVTSPEGAVRRAVVRALGGGTDVDEVRIRGENATATARPADGRYAGARVEVSLAAEGRRWRVDSIDPVNRPGS